MMLRSVVKITRKGPPNQGKHHIHYGFSRRIQVIPDGNGGALVATVTYQQGQFSTQVTDVGGSQGTANISNLAASDMVLGDQGTYFVTDGNQIVDVDEASGSEMWDWQPSNNSTVQIIAATSGGGVAVLNGTDNFVLLDQSEASHVSSLEHVRLRCWVFGDYTRLRKCGTVVRVCFWRRPRRRY
jgi:hypothetical protein